MNGFFTRLGVSEVVFPWVIPNINLQTNRIKLNYNVNGIPQPAVTIELLPAFYTPAQLAAELQLQIQLADATELDQSLVRYGQSIILPGPFTATGIPSFEFLFSGTAGNLITASFEPMTYQPNPTLPYFYEFNEVRQLFNLLGLNSVNSPTAGRNPIFGAVTLCQSTRYVDIVCSLLTYNQSLKDTTSQPIARDMLCRVYLGNTNQKMDVAPEDPLFAPPGTRPTVISTMYSTPKQIQWTPNQPVSSGLTFQVYDDNGVILDSLFPTLSGTNTQAEYNLSADVNWSMTILVSEN
jgi:hypothetical protein